MSPFVLAFVSLPVEARRAAHILCVRDIYVYKHEQYEHSGVLLLVRVVCESSLIRKYSYKSVGFLTMFQSRGESGRTLNARTIDEAQQWPRLLSAEAVAK